MNRQISAKGIRTAKEILIYIHLINSSKLKPNAPRKKSFHRFNCEQIVLQTGVN